MTDHPSENAPEQSEITATLIKRLRQGDTHAGRMLDEQFRRPIERFCRGYLGSDTAAEDAVQEIFVKVITAETVPDNFRAWLYRVARNHCLDELRRRKRRRSRQGLPEHDVYEPLTGNLTRMVRSEERAEMLGLLGQLHEAHREVLWLRYTEDLSRSEISDVLELPESVVKSRLFEAAKRLRELADEVERRERRCSGGWLPTPAM